MSSTEALELKRCPFNQLPLFAILDKFSPLCPKPLDADVQNGITVLLVKSFA